MDTWHAQGMTTNCPACDRLPGAIKCNAHRRADTSATAQARRAAVAEYLATGPLSAERIAHYDAATKG